MGTTLVMAVGHRHEIYIAHVGDSRAYLITRTGCYQITLDDDVAAREVRLGYALYRDALQQPSAGSLVQAIGMSASVHPTIGRFVIDEDCVFLLCSDGLSDFELVDQCWESEILPILDGKLDIATATRQLVEIGNTHNGHDNITVALVHCQVNISESETPLSYSLPIQTGISSPTTVLPSQGQNFSDRDDLEDTQLLPSRENSRRFANVLLGISLVGLLISIGGGLLLAYLDDRGQLPDWLSFNFGSMDKRRSPDTPTTDTLVQARSMFVTKSKTILNRTAIEETAIASPNPQLFSSIKGILPAGSVVQVVGKKEFLEQGMWLNLKVVDVCSSSNSGLTNTIPKPAANDSAPKTPIKQPANKANSSQGSGARLLQQGEFGWIQAANIEQQLLPIAAMPADRIDSCSDLVPESSKPLK